MKFFHTCSSDPKDRPPNSTKLPCAKEGFHEWVQHVECRSTESLRPIHAMVMQISRLRMHLLARHIRTSIRGWWPQWLVQAKTDAWRLSCPKSKMPEVKKLQSLQGEVVVNLGTGAPHESYAKDSSQASAAGCA